MSVSRSSSSISAFSLLSSIPTASSAPLELQHKDKLYLRIDHPLNRRKGTPQLKIWEIGQDYISASSPDQHTWRCGYYASLTILSNKISTSSCIHHLRRIH